MQSTLFPCVAVPPRVHPFAAHPFASAGRIAVLARIIALAMFPAAMLLSTKTLGSSFALAEQSASRLGTAFSGTAAAADDATTVYYNPAGMSQLRQAEAAVVFTGVDIGSEFRNANSQPALGQPLGTQGGDAGGWNALPAGYFVLPAGENLAFGLALNVPFGLKLEYDDGWIGRFQALNSEIQTYNLNPALSFRINDSISVGLGVNYQRIQAELTNAVNYTAVVGQGLQQLAAGGQLPPSAVPALLAANAGLEGDTRVRGDDSAWGYNAGVLIALSPDTRLGVAYRSSIQYGIRGSVRFAPPAATDATGAAIIGAASAPGGTLATGPVTVDLEVPDTATASLSHRLGNDVELLADIAWTGWSSLQELRVVRDSGTTLSVTPERWQDTWRYALGATYKVSDTWKLRAGVAFDQTPVPDATRTARLPDADRKWVAAGAQWMPTKATVVDFGYAHLFTDDVSINQDDGSAAVYGLLNGRQESSINIASVQFAYRF
jgi:long-chain fatty acid transport protein